MPPAPSHLCEPPTPTPATGLKGRAPGHARLLTDFCCAALSAGTSFGRSRHKQRTLRPGSPLPSRGRWGRGGELLRSQVQTLGPQARRPRPAPAARPVVWRLVLRRLGSFTAGALGPLPTSPPLCSVSAFPVPILGPIIVSLASPDGLSLGSPRHGAAFRSLLAPPRAPRGRPLLSVPLHDPHTSSQAQSRPQ